MTDTDAERRRRFEAIAGPADGAAVHDALGALPAKEAELLRLWAWEGLGPTQIGVALGISANAAAIRLHRAKRRLAAALHDESGIVPARGGAR